MPLAPPETVVSEVVERALRDLRSLAAAVPPLPSKPDFDEVIRRAKSVQAVLSPKLQELRAIYREREGKELEILILSDHGQNHAGGGKRIAIKRFLARHGYRVTKSPAGPKDVVLPTAGIESWVEIHNSRSETTNLVHLLSHLAGVDLITAPSPDQTHRFMVLNSKGELAFIESKGNSFKYEIETGDPLNHRPVVEALAHKHELDSDGFASADAWMAETLTHQYPLALERIVRGHTTLALNPASILISLDNAYVHSGWLLKRGISLVRSGGTHGALDNINSTGVLLSSFAPTSDTSTSRAALLFDGFTGRSVRHPGITGAQWARGKQVLEQTTQPIRDQTPLISFVPGS